MTQAAGDDAEQLVHAAASGDDAALRALLDRLSGEAGQRPALAALLNSGDPALWSRLLHFAAHGSHSAAAGADEQQQQSARNAIATAYTTSRGAASADARNQALAAALSDSDPAVRALGVDLLGRRGDGAALPALTAAMTDRADSVRVAAVRALGGQDPEQAVPLLLQALERFDIVSGEAVNSLIRIGHPAEPALIRELQGGTAWGRWHAARALGGIGGEQAIVPLLDALRDDDSGVRWEAVHALSAYGPAVVDPLLRALTTHAVTPWFAEGADRVLNRVATGALHSSLASLHEKLHHLDAAVEVPVEAARVRQALQSQG